MEHTIKEYKNFSNEQKIALKLCIEKKNLFITGGAGTGKSYIIKRIIYELKKIGLNIMITASTGTAAYNINGCTIHSALGLKYKSEKKQMVIKENIINNLDVLIIDEISMVSCELFDIIYNGINEIRYKNKNYDKLQYILVGDFLQLPPVEKYKKIKYAFESENWNKCITNVVELKTNFRNKDNEVFIKNLSNNKIIYNEIIPTKFYTRNNKKLSILKGDLYKYKMYYEKKYDNIDNFDFDEVDNFLDIIINDCRKKCIDLINLKIGAQIIATKNISKNIYNGSKGFIIGFKNNYKLKFNNIPTWKEKDILKIEKFIINNNNILPIIKFENNKPFILEPSCFTFDGLYNSSVDIIQLPIRLGYAITVHKCQGMSINKCIIRLNYIFTSGQVFVALSRIMDLNNVKVLNFNKNKIKVDKKCINFY